MREQIKINEVSSFDRDTILTYRATSFSKTISRMNINILEFPHVAGRILARQSTILFVLPNRTELSRAAVCLERWGSISYRTPPSSSPSFLYLSVPGVSRSLASSSVKYFLFENTRKMRDAFDVVRAIDFVVSPASVFRRISRLTRVSSLPLRIPGERLARTPTRLCKSSFPRFYLLLARNTIDRLLYDASTRFQKSDAPEKSNGESQEGR